jgi:hypothetical protein
MQRPLIAVFVLKNENTKTGYLNALLGADRAESLWTAAKDPVLISRGGATDTLPADSAFPQVDIVLFEDGGYEPRTKNTRSRLLQRLVDGERLLAVVQHLNTNGSTHLAQKEMLEREMGGHAPATAAVVKEHHNTGRVFEHLCSVASAIAAKDHRAYDSAVSALVRHVVGDLQLQARLELLHACLTPEAVHQLKVADGSWGVWGAHREMLDFFAQHRGSPFDPRYIEKLRAFRNALLDTDL